MKYHCILKNIERKFKMEGNIEELETIEDHTTANILMERKNDLNSMTVKELRAEIKSKNYPIKNYQKLNKESLISEIVMWEADNEIVVSADELDAILNDNISTLS